MQTIHGVNLLFVLSVQQENKFALKRDSLHSIISLFFKARYANHKIYFIKTV